jgi:hypothetical protein
MRVMFVSDMSNLFGMSSLAVSFFAWVQQSAHRKEFWSGTLNPSYMQHLMARHGVPGLVGIESQTGRKRSTQWSEKGV